MNRQTFLEYLGEPSKLYQMSLVELQGLVLEYPYSATLRLLLLLKARLEDHPRQEEMLAQLASRTFNREFLYDMLRELDREEKQRTEIEERLELPELDKLEFAFAEPATSEEPKVRVAEISEPIADLATSPAKIDDYTVADNEDIQEESSALEIELEVPPFPKVANVQLSRIVATAVAISGITSDFKLPARPATSVPPQPKAPGKAATVAPEIKNRLRRHRKKQLQKLKHQQRDRIREIARSSVSSKDDTASETLAQLLARQGQYANAIKMYERLSLLNPEKSAKFAGLIKELKEKL